MRLLIAVFFCFSCVFTLTPAMSYQGGAAGNVYAPPAADVPLVVIRFNQRKVLYERQLYNAIAKAVEIKPSVVFDVVSFLPSQSKKAVSKAQSQTHQVVTSMRNMGIPQERIRVNREPASGIKAHEVHIYVE